MAIKLTTTAKSAHHVKMVCYGQAGVGKTTLCATAPNPVIISAEGGLLSLKDHSIPVIEILSKDDMAEAYRFITESEHAKDFETICLDSITDIAEVYLGDLKETFADPRQAYGELADKMGKMIRAFRDIRHRHVYFTAKVKKTTDSDGITSYSAHMPGSQLPLNMPYWFDLVLPLHIGMTAENEQYRFLQTQGSLHWEAKDRSGQLPNPQKPDLADVFRRVLASEPAEKQSSPAKEDKSTPEPKKGGGKGSP